MLSVASANEHFRAAGMPREKSAAETADDAIKTTLSAAADKLELQSCRNEMQAGRMEMQPNRMETHTNRGEHQMNRSERAASEERAPAVTGEDGLAFILAPTPAQLGRAPLQRRQSMGECAVGVVTGFPRVMR